MLTMTIRAFQTHILKWHAKHPRPMPWRNTKNPYRIMVSEVMLQQTQVSRVLPKYKEFLAAFPTLEALKDAPQATLLKAWQGLGYWRRALRLQQSARQILNAGKATLAEKTNFKSVGCGRGFVPRPAGGGEQRGETLFKIWFSTPSRLEILPGIGHYTARAIACFAFQNQGAFLDTNIRRVYIHFFFAGKQNVSDKEILPVAQKAVWKENPREWHYALFDYGAMVLKDKTINRQSRHYAKQSAFEGSLRSFRTRVVNLLLDQPEHRLQKTKLVVWLNAEIQKQNRPYTADEIIASLLADNLLKSTPHEYYL
ncbi:MAG: A/G-specific adenine glycosylase [Candidatus Wildermuthbacteria bacterium]|nr:A/G-specific adenine glycosylase [Candidatus Wildermuthbacteria bacterium]